MSSGQLGIRQNLFDVAAGLCESAGSSSLENTGETRLEVAVGRTRDWLLAQQHADGHWCAELQGDSILESEYLLLLAFLGRLDSPLAAPAARYLLDQQAEHGGWAAFPGGPVEVSGSVKAYLALRLCGYPADQPELVRAQRAIVAAGGVERVNSFTRFYLALLGLIPYSDCPAVPPELILAPSWFPLNIYEMSAWSRTIVVPLSLLWACQPKVTLPADITIAELYASPQRRMPRFIGGVHLESVVDGRKPAWWNWGRFFQGVDQSLKWLEAWGVKPLRGRALKQCEQWILDRLPDSDGLGAIFPPIIWTIIGLRCLGYRDDHPLIEQQHRELEKLVLKGNDTQGAETVRLQPCLSPVWDTAISLIALRDAGIPRTAPVIQRGIQWLLSREVKQRGDWSRTRPEVEPGGWYFEYRNEFYPDVDDTCMVLIALGRCLPEGLGQDWLLSLPTASERNQVSAGNEVIVSGRSASAELAIRELEQHAPLLGSIQRGVKWLRAMQSRDGGWGAFDHDNTREVLTKVPFADHNAMIDPSTADITARVVESFAGLGISQHDPAVQAALRFVWADQQHDHSWFGRWGVNYLYGTWQVIVGLRAIGIEATDSRISRAADWLVATQQTHGGWGETPASYDDPALRGTGIATASQTAWALLGLLAAGRENSDAVTKGVNYLLETQQDDGTWLETEFTGTGFPRVFYLRYHYYPIYFPLMALARYRTATRDAS